MIQTRHFARPRGIPPRLLLHAKIRAGLASACVDLYVEGCLSFRLQGGDFLDRIEHNGESHIWHLTVNELLILITRRLSGRSQVRPTFLRLVDSLFFGFAIRCAERLCLSEGVFKISRGYASVQWRTEAEPQKNFKGGLRKGRPFRTSAGKPEERCAGNPIGIELNKGRAQ